MQKSEYLDAKSQLKDLHRSQWQMKKQLRLQKQYTSKQSIRMDRNKVQSPEGHPGATYIPQKAFQEFMASRIKESHLQRKINKNTKQIRDLELKILEAKLIRRAQSSIDQAINKQFKHTLKTLTQKLFNLQGLFVHDDGVIANGKGKRIGEMRMAPRFDGEYIIRYMYFVDALNKTIELKVNYKGLHL